MSCGRAAEFLARTHRRWNPYCQVDFWSMNDVGLHTKNILASDFEKHVAIYTGKDEYLGMN